jgi:hypothetical protein
VRGICMNPVDHPMGGRTNGGGGWHHPVSPWGTPAKGLQDAQEQAHRLDDRSPSAAQARSEGITKDGTFRSRRARSSTITCRRRWMPRARPTTSGRSRPGRGARRSPPSSSG